MYEALRHPCRNAAILGLLQGVPQGLSFPDQKAFVGAGFDEANLLLLVVFGLAGPPVMAVFSHFANGRKQPAWWRKFSEYVNLPQMIFWGGISLGAFAYCSLTVSNAQEGFAVCGFFVSAGIGFLAAGFLEQWLLRRAGNAT
jgi:hypothetical protein